MLAEGKKNYSAWVKTCQDGATCCSACSQICARGGPLFGAMAECCAKCCDHCAKACERSPWDNGHAEGFHSRFRDEFLAMKEFGTLAAARRLIKLWRDDYNQPRPHSSLGYVPPMVFAARYITSVTEKASAASQPSPSSSNTPEIALNACYRNLMLVSRAGGYWLWLSKSSCTNTEEGLPSSSRGR